MKKKKGIHIRKEEGKSSLNADNIILHIENPKKSTKELLELIYKFGKVADQYMRINSISVHS